MTQENDFPFPFLEHGAVDSDSDSEDPDSDLEDLLNNDHLGQDQPDADADASGKVHTYLGSVKEKVAKSMNAKQLPECYQQGQFWIHPPQPYFAMRKSAKSADGLNPTSLYYPPVFLWLPHLLDDTPIMCQNSGCKYYQKCSHPMTIKGWNTDPVARRVVGLDHVYYIMTQRIQCKATGSSDGCGKSVNLYDPLVLDQLEPGLAASFPAFLTHRSGIDKTLLTMIRAGIAHRLSASSWSKIMCELHVREHDICELQYLHAIYKEKKLAAQLDVAEKSYIPFSEFKDKDGYAGFYPSRWYINNVYMDYMEHIRPILDQCMAALTGYVIKWDHSFKLSKYLMKLDGVVTFAALFTLVNELSQIRYQAFVPTKSLAHIRAGLEAMVKSLKDHGLAEPALGFTDNVAGDAATFMQCIPSLAENVIPAQLDEFSDLPTLVLPSDVSIHLCSTEAEIQSACLSILENLSDGDGSMIHIGFDMEWEFSVGHGASGSQKTSLIQVALQNAVYLLRVHLLKKLPNSLKTILNSMQVIKIGRNVGGDLGKLSRDFPDFVIPVQKKAWKKGIVELGKLASAKNAVSHGNASLAVITAATLHQNLSKETRLSEWDAPTLSSDQIQYAALDAWVALQIWDVLKAQNTVGVALSSATPIGQPVSLFVKKQEVAYGVIIKQPVEFVMPNDDPESQPTKIRVSTTKTRAVIRIDEVLAPKCIMSYHKKSLENIQNGQDSFEAVVHICHLRTRSSNPPVVSVLPTEPSRVIGPAKVVLPPVDTNLISSASPTRVVENQQLLTDEVEGEDNSPTHSTTGICHSNNINNDGSGSDSESSDGNDDNEGGDENEEDIKEYLNVTYRQPSKYISYLARILADVFHEIYKVCRTISKMHTLCRQFGSAFSDTMLIPDQGDKKAVEAVLAQKGLKWTTVRAKSPAWLWSRVRRYIPEKDLLHRNLKELFDCWGPIKCTVTGQALFSEETWKKAQGVLHDVKKGWISDPSAIPLYTVNGCDKNGLTLFHCIRGTNSVEGGVHNSIRKNFGSLNASPELADALLADFRHRHNVDCGALHKWGRKYEGHYDPWIEHDISTLQADIQWKTKPVIARWRINQDTDPLNFVRTDEQFGIACIPGITCIQTTLLGQ